MTKYHPFVRWRKYKMEKIWEVQSISSQHFVTGQHSRGLSCRVFHIPSPSSSLQAECLEAVTAQQVPRAQLTTSFASGHESYSLVHTVEVFICSGARAKTGVQQQLMESKDIEVRGKIKAVTRNGT